MVALFETTFTHTHTKAERPCAKKMKDFEDDDSVTVCCAWPNNTNATSPTHATPSPASQTLHTLSQGTSWKPLRFDFSPPAKGRKEQDKEKSRPKESSVTPTPSNKAKAGNHGNKTTTKNTTAMPVKKTETTISYTKSSTTAHQNRVDWSILQKMGWTVRHLSIIGATTQLVGLKLLAPKVPPADLRQAAAGNSLQSLAIVESVDPRGLAVRYDIAVGDVLCTPKLLDGNWLSVATLNQATEWAKRRPFVVSLLSPPSKKKAAKSQDSTTAPSSQPQGSTFQQPMALPQDQPLKKAAPSPPQESVPIAILKPTKMAPIAKPIDDMEVAHFCRGCKGTSSHHHAWCRHNPFFQTPQGGAEIVQRIQRGIKIHHCPACQLDWKMGKLTLQFPHKDECLQGQDGQLRKRDEMSDPPPVTAPLPKPSKRQGPRKKPGPKPKKKRMAPRLTKPKRTPKAATASSVAVITPATSSRKRHQRVEKAKHQPPESLPVATIPTFQSQWKAFAGNPWGSPGYQDGDVILFGGNESQSTKKQNPATPSERFEACPFDKKYQNTHNDKGMIVLELRRDPYGLLPWGLEIERDEFGHACIVSSVDPLSPASAATPLGKKEETTALQVNDMILAVQGRPVFEWTVADLQAYLSDETCKIDQSLFLTVARYKYADRLQQALVQTERNLLESMDQAARDIRRMGWMEIGTTTAMESSTSHSVKPAPAAQSLDHQKVLTAAPTLINTVEQQESPTEINEAKVGERTTKEKNGGKPADLVEKDGPQIQNKTTGETNAGVTIQEEDDDEEEYSPDGNAWLGCVCGNTHSDDALVFWIQCDECNSWYDVSAECVGFDQGHAESSKVKWFCPACQPPSQEEQLDEDISLLGGLLESTPPASPGAAFHEQLDNQPLETNHLTNELPAKARDFEEFPIKSITPQQRMAQNKGTKRALFQDSSKSRYSDDQSPRQAGGFAVDLSSLSQTSSKTLSQSQSETDSPSSTDFRIGEMVQVLPFSWSYVNCQGGIGHIVEKKKDRNGNWLYDVKYLVGSGARLQRDVSPSFLTLYDAASEKTIRRKRRRTK